MDSSWKNLQIRMEAAWNMRTTPKTKRPKTGDIISSAHSLDWNKKMYPTEEKIEKLKKQALRLLPEKIRQETDWQAKGLVLRNVDIYVLIDGMNDKSAEEKVALELKI